MADDRDIKVFRCSCGAWRYVGHGCNWCKKKEDER